METDRNNNCVYFPPEAFLPQATFPEVNRFASAHLNLDIVTDNTYCYAKCGRSGRRGLQ